MLSLQLVLLSLYVSSRFRFQRAGRTSGNGCKHVSHQDVVPCPQHYNDGLLHPQALQRLALIVYNIDFKLFITLLLSDTR